MTPKAISDVNRSERIEPYQFLNGYTAQDWRDFIENVTEGAAEFRGNDYRRLIGDLEEAASLIARLRVDGERMDFLEQRVRDTHGQFFYNIGKRISFDWAGAGTLRNAIDAAIAASRSTGAADMGEDRG